MENDLVRLNIVGITYNQIENGMYALVLEEEEGKLRLPIIIGYNEAQSIECILQKISTPRPLTHELLTQILDAFDIRIESVVIKHLPNGIFAADISLSKDGSRHILDARSSDAIALAMRKDAPIYTSRSLLEKCGVEKEASSPAGNRIIHNKSVSAKKIIEQIKHRPVNNSLDLISDVELQILMKKASDEENYEKADEIKKEIEKRKKNNTQQS